MPSLAVAADPTSLDNLVDVVAPAPVPWWPPAPGWFVVAGALAIAALISLVAWARRWKANAYRREALCEFDAIARESAADPLRLSAVPELVKRTALAAWPRDVVAGLSGDRWLEFLDRTGRTAQFTRGPGAALPDLAYDPRFPMTLEPTRARALLDIVRDWIARHDGNHFPNL